MYVLHIKEHLCYLKIVTNIKIILGLKKNLDSIEHGYRA